MWLHDGNGCPRLMTLWMSHILGCVSFMSFLRVNPLCMEHSWFTVFGNIWIRVKPCFVLILSNINDHKYSCFRTSFNMLDYNITTWFLYLLNTGLRTTVWAYSPTSGLFVILVLAFLLPSSLENSISNHPTFTAKRKSMSCLYNSWRFDNKKFVYLNVIFQSILFHNLYTILKNAANE